MFTCNNKKHNSLVIILGTYRVNSNKSTIITKCDNLRHGLHYNAHLRNNVSKSEVLCIVLPQSFIYTYLRKTRQENLTTKPKKLALISPKSRFEPRPLRVGSARGVRVNMTNLCKAPSLCRRSKLGN